MPHAGISCVVKSPVVQQLDGISCKLVFVASYAEDSADTYALLVYASTQTNGFDFDLDGDQASPSVSPFNFLRKSEPGSFLTADGNDYANLADYSAVTSLKAEESCIVVTVRGMQEGLEGGAPIPEITIKAEGGVRLLHSQYNQEPWMALGITWAAFFQKLKFVNFSSK